MSYLGLGGVFTANMTGNLVLLGFAIGGTAEFDVWRAVASLAGFALGAWTAGRLTERWHVQAGRLLRRVSGLVTVVLLVCWILIAVLFTAKLGGEALRLLCIGLLAWSMGLINATARTLDMRDIPTTVATSTISDLAASAGRDVPRSVQLVRATAIGTMLLGALCGALLVHAEGPTTAFALAFGGALAATGLQLRARRARDQALRVS